MTERSLGDLPEYNPETDAEVQDSPDPETFDVGRWADGIRAVRRAALIFVDDDAVDLAVDMDVIAEQIDVLPAGEQRDNLIDTYDSLREDLLAAATKVVIEAHSRERRKADEKRIVRELGYTSSNALRQKRADKLTEAEQEQLLAEGVHVMCHLLAEQIVEPALSGEDIHRLWQVRDSEVNKLASLMSEVNSQAMVDSSVVTRDFSHRRSGRR